MIYTNFNVVRKKIPLIFLVFIIYYSKCSLMNNFQFKFRLTCYLQNMKREF